ncbi:AMMECR1 domain-containing protein, partial [Naematelia encephala]
MTIPVPRDPSPSAAEACFVFDILTANVEAGWKGDLGYKGAIPSAGHKSALFVKYKLFEADGVTWSLRGCMGTFEPYELEEGLAKWAVISGSKDPRWGPITAEELPNIECTVSFLSPFEDCTDYLDWTIGNDGIRIFLPETCKPDPSHPEPALIPPSNPLSATYLPEIAVEHGWTKDEAIESACWKSGYRGVVDEDLKRQLVCKKYSTKKFTLKYSKYLEFKKVSA